MKQQRNAVVQGEHRQDAPECRLKYVISNKEYGLYRMPQQGLPQGHKHQQQLKLDWTNWLNIIWPQLGVEYQRTRA